jgi:membrane-bound ClpP family serine protease
VASALFFFAVVSFAMKARQRTVRTGSEQMVGSFGEVVSWSGGEGRVLVLGEMWAARADKELPRGTRVRVVKRENLTLFVVAEN